MNVHFATTRNLPYSASLETHYTFVAAPVDTIGVTIMKISIAIVNTVERRIAIYPVMKVKLEVSSYETAHACGAQWSTDVTGDDFEYEY